jgi:predicted site-specific integrase-resolvase
MNEDLPIMITPSGRRSKRYVRIKKQCQRFGYLTVKQAIYHYYVEEKEPLSLIALRFGISYETLRRWMKRLEIPFRPRGGVRSRNKF